MAKSTVAVKFTGDTKDLKKATSNAERDLGGFGSRVGPKLKAGLLAVGAAAGTAFVDGLNDKIQRDKVQARIVGSMGLSDVDAERLGSIAGEVYADGFGESFEQVSEATAAVMGRLEEFANPDQLEPITKKALDLSYIFEQEVGTTIESVRYLLVNGLAPDAENAFDVITTALQRVAPEMRGEVLDAIGEYAQSFGALGLDAQESMELIVAAGQDTSVGIDKVGDAVKEFLIRATDGSDATVSALEAIGLPAEEISNDLLAGGEVAEEAFQKIVTALLGVEDPSARAQLAIALFGTPIEDLSADKIPTFLEALQGVEDGFGDVEDASDDAVEALEGNAREYEKAMRKLESVQQAFVIGVVDGFEAMTDGYTDLINKINLVTEALEKIPGVADAVNGVINNLPGGGPKKSELTLDPAYPVPDIVGDVGNFLPQFADGGTVPGPKGKATAAIVHGGEHVLTTDEVDAARRGGGSLVDEIRGLRADLRERDGVSIVNYYPTPESAADAIERSLRKAAVAMAGA